MRTPADVWIYSGIDIVRSDAHRATWLAMIEGWEEVFGEIVAGPLPVVKKHLLKFVAEDSADQKWEVELSGNTQRLFIVPFID